MTENLKPGRYKASPGLTFNHSAVGEGFVTEDKLAFWFKILKDQRNKHLHAKAKWKIKWLNRKMTLLKKLVR